MIGTKLGPYEITAKLGEGGMGEVFRARDTKLDREVAIKVLPEAFTEDKERLARFEREARVLAQLQHQNIASIYGMEESGNTRALVMELVEGPTLADRLESGPIPSMEAFSIARQIAEALEQAHEKGIVHRDLKPQNIKASIEGNVKVLDFGLAKAMDAGSSSSGGPVTASPTLMNSPTLTAAGTQLGVILGTAAYMAPEQARGGAVDKRADIWSFGVVLYEMLAGRSLFAADTVTDTLAGVLKTEIDLDALPASTPPAIRRLVRRCLERKPKNRLHDIADARIVLDEVASGADLGDTVAPAPAGSRGALLAWAIALVATLAAVLFAWRGREAALPASAPTIRFEVAWPGALASSIDLSTDFFDLSPDGRELLLVAEDRIWVRPLDSLEVRPLADTQGASYPFWSPDGASIGFFAGGELRRVALAGGPAQKLCDAPGGRGAAWGPDGTIVFSSSFGSEGLSRVGERGGTPVRLPRVASSPASTGDHRYPQFLPDGRHFLFTYLSGSPDAAGIYVGDLDGSTPKRVLDGSDSALFAASSTSIESGYLLYRRDNVLMAVRFDTERLQVSGDALPLVEGVGLKANTGHGAFSVADNGMLAYAEGTNREQELVWLDRSGRRLESIARSKGWIRGFGLSPDERTLAWALSEDDATSDLWLRELPAGAPSRFTFGSAPGWMSPIWSPDGSELAYSTFDLAGQARYEIRKRRVDRVGSEDTLRVAERSNYLWDWSAEGNRLAFEDEAANLWLLELGSDREPVPFAAAEGEQTQAQFSPDGHWLAYVSTEQGDDQIFVQPVPETGAKWQVSSTGGGMPRWGKQGLELYYRAPDGSLVVVDVRSGATSFDFDAPRKLPIGIPASQNLYFFTYEPAPDGERFLVQLRSAATEPPVVVVLHWERLLEER